MVAYAMSSPVLAQTESPFVQFYAKYKLGEFIRYDVETGAKRKGYDLTEQQKQCYAEKVQTDFLSRAEITAKSILTTAEIQALDKQISQQLFEKIQALKFIHLSANKDFSADEINQLQAVLTPDLYNQFYEKWMGSFSKNPNTKAQDLDSNGKPAHEDWQMYYAMNEFAKDLFQKTRVCGFEIEYP